MNLRGRLFVKIFLGFWLVTVAILGSWLLTDDYFRSLPAGDAVKDSAGNQVAILTSTGSLIRFESAVMAQPPAAEYEEPGRSTTAIVSGLIGLSVVGVAVYADIKNANES